MPGDFGVIAVLGGDAFNRSETFSGGELFESSVTRFRSVPTRGTLHVMSATATPGATVDRLPPIGRLAFVVAGLGLFATKYALDHSVARFVFGRGWAPWDYLVTSVPISSLINFTDDVTFHLTLLAIAIPFIVVGVALTLARLRAAGLPAALTIFFFLPVLNLLFFLLLALSPSMPAARRAVP